MNKPTQHSAAFQMPSFVKFFYNAFKTVFTSESKNDFARLKNFIAS